MEHTRSRPPSARLGSFEESSDEETLPAVENVLSPGGTDKLDLNEQWVCGHLLETQTLCKTPSRLRDGDGA